MTGALTIPLTVAAFWLNATWQKIVFAAFALLCAGIASYRIWAKATERGDELEAKLIAKPRLVLGYDQKRGYNPRAQEYESKWHPFYLRNDGNDTAVNIQIADNVLDRTNVTFAVSANHLIPGEVADVDIYKTGNGRIDKHIERLFIDPIEARIKAGEKGRMELRLPVIVSYADHGGRSFAVRFDVIGSARPREGAAFLMESLRVELIRAPEVSRVSSERA